MRRRARLAGFSLVGVALLGAAGYLLLPLAVQALISAIDLTLNASVWLAEQIGEGADRSTILMAVGREAFRAFTSSRALAVIGALVLLGAAALYGLQRLLGLGDEEGLR